MKEKKKKHFSKILDLDNNREECGQSINLLWTFTLYFLLFPILYKLPLPPWQTLFGSFSLYSYNEVGSNSRSKNTFPQENGT